ncbi:MAG TPA: ABC transporter substrate-binding protein [Ohtaekwangia sp.]
MMKVFQLSIALLFCTVILSSAQIDYNKQFFNAKQFFREGKYNLAMEGFKPLIPYDQNNQFSEYASFYYALSAYNQNFRAVAKDMLGQLKIQHPAWDKIDEVNLWLAKIHFENKDYFQAMKMLSAIQDKKMQKDIDALKTQSLTTLTDIETLKMMREEYPKDEIIGIALAKVLSQNLSVPENRTLLESIIDTYKLKRTDYIPEAPKTVHKDIYTVSVVMPFMVSTLDPAPTRKRNQIVLDFYEGMKLAADTLGKQGIKISLRAYDTERNNEKIKTLLGSDELKSSDLLVGPFFQEENKAIQDFSLTQRINVFNPLSNSSDAIGTNPYAFLYQPSVETQGAKSGEFLAAYAHKKNCIVYYGTSRRDSLLAATFAEAATKNGMKIISSERITRELQGKITTTLATPTEFDEYRYPKQFSLKKDSLGSIFVASDDPLLYNKVLGAVETRGDSIVVLGSEMWLEQPAVDLEKYQILPVVLAAPNFALFENIHYQAFIKKFSRVHGRVPSTYARMGYEFMLFSGNQLKKNGVYFQEALAKEGVIPGYLTQGYNYQFSRDNHLVPFVRFQKGKATVVGKY